MKNVQLYWDKLPRIILNCTIRNCIVLPSLVHDRTVLSNMDKRKPKGEPKTNYCGKGGVVRNSLVSKTVAAWKAVRWRVRSLNHVARRMHVHRLDGQRTRKPFRRLSRHRIERQPIMTTTMSMPRPCHIPKCQSHDRFRNASNYNNRKSYMSSVIYRIPGGPGI